MASYRDLLKQAKQRIREVTAEDAEARLGAATFLDVREQDEYDQGTIPGSVFIPRGHLESQAETKLSDRDQPIVVFCAGGNRSAFAAETLQQLGFTDVVSMTGGFGRWKDEGRPWITPAALSPEQRNRYGRHILLPEVGEAGQQKLLESKVLLLGAGGLGSPGGALPRRRGCGHPRHRRHGRRRRVEPAAPDPAQHGSHRRAQGRLGEEDSDCDQPRRRRRHLRRAARSRQRRRRHPAATT